MKQIIKKILSEGDFDWVSDIPVPFTTLGELFDQGKLKEGDKVEVKGIAVTSLGLERKEVHGILNIIDIRDDFDQTSVTSDEETTVILTDEEGWDYSEFSLLNSDRDLGVISINGNKTLNENDFDWAKEIPSLEELNVTEDNWYIKARVIISPDSEHYNQSDVPGTIIYDGGYLDFGEEDRWVGVRWDDGKRNDYRIGPKIYDLNFYYGDDETINENDFEWTSEIDIDDITKLEMELQGTNIELDYQFSEDGNDHYDFIDISIPDNVNIMGRGYQEITFDYNGNIISTQPIHLNSIRDGVNTMQGDDITRDFVYNQYKTISDALVKLFPNNYRYV